MWALKSHKNETFFNACIVNKFIIDCPTRANRTSEAFLGACAISQRKDEGDDPEIDTAQTPKRFNWRLALVEKIRKTFTDSITNNITFYEHNETVGSYCLGASFVGLPFRVTG